MLYRTNQELYIDMTPSSIRLFKTLSLLLLLASWQAPADAADQILATVGSLQVTATELKSAMASAPFASKFPSMNQDDQASLRGDMLRRLVAAKLLTLEGQRLGLDQSASYRRDSENFRLSLLYRAYMNKLRQGIVVPSDTLEAMNKQFKNDHDGLNAAKSAFISDRYRQAKRSAIQKLIESYKVQLHNERIVAGAAGDTLLAEGNGIRVSYADLLEPDEIALQPSQEILRERLQQRVELLAAAKSVSDQGIDVSAAVQTYAQERMPAVVMENKTKEWIPNEETLRDWYSKHPQIGVVPERRHIGHLIVATRKLAEKLHSRITKGESLFVLAGKYSTEPVSRKQKGDIGWVIQGRGTPELEQVLSKLKDGEISDVIATKDGKFHIITVLERIGGRQEGYEQIRERIAQSIVNAKLPEYIHALEQRYGVTWNLLSNSGNQTVAKNSK